MCSPETQALGVKYTESLLENCCDNRDDYFPFYEAVLDWMKNDGNMVAEVESWPEVDYVNGPVPVLVFHPSDNAECKAVISSSFDSAKSSLAYVKQIKYTLNRKYYDVLTAQRSNILQLANNAEFEAWTFSDWDPDAPAAQWTDEVRESVNQTPIEAASDVERAIYALFWWRESYGLEDAKMFRRQLDEPYFPAERYEMCTEQTQGLGAIYDQFQLTNCCENGDDYYPFIDRIIDWIKEQPIHEPVYNDGDNSECREIVDSYHKDTISSLASAQKLQSNLDEKYEQVLAAQSAQGIQLANNAEFEAWTVSDWDQSYEYEQDPNAPVPQWPDYVRDKVNEAPVVTSEDV